MGQENSSAFNCGIFERDNRSEVRGDQAMKIRKMLQQERMRYETPSRDTDSTKPVTSASLKQTPQLDHKIKNQPYFEHSSILRLSKEPFEKCIETEHGFYEYAAVSLSSLIESRYNSKLLFPEEQVLRLLESIVYAIAYLESKGWQHHDIYPTNIYYVDGIFKLAHPRFVQTSYQLTIDRKRFSFLSPELIISLRQEEEEIDLQYLYKSDVFSLGMTLLEFCSLKPSCEVYDQDNYDIIDSRKNDRLDEIRQRYSPKVAEVISAMLEYEVDLRVTSIPLARRINQQLSEINAQQEATKRVQQAVQAQAPPHQHSVKMIPPQGMQKPPQISQQQHNEQYAMQLQPPPKMTNIPPVMQLTPPQFYGPPGHIVHHPQPEGGYSQLRIVTTSNTQMEGKHEQPPRNEPAVNQQLVPISEPPKPRLVVPQPTSPMQPTADYRIQESSFSEKKTTSFQSRPQSPDSKHQQLSYATQLLQPRNFNEISQSPLEAKDTFRQFAPPTLFTTDLPEPPAARLQSASIFTNSIPRTSLQEPQYSSSNAGYDNAREEYRKTSQLLARLNIDNSKLTSTTAESNKTFSQAPLKGAEESLDERVRRILEKSKQIK